MNKPIFLFVGKSASGKTTIADMLGKDGYSQVYSYTTRPKRHENEIGHTFITDEEYDKLENIVASTLYNGYRYCTTLEQIQEADIYVIDIPGVETLMENYYKLNRKVHVLYFDADVCTRIRRMLNRDDSDTQIIGRLLNDEERDWEWWLGDIWNDYGLKFSVKNVDADCPLQDVYREVKKHMEDTIEYEEH